MKSQSNSDLGLRLWPEANNYPIVILHVDTTKQIYIINTRLPKQVI